MLFALCALFSRCPRRRQDARRFFLMLLLAVRALKVEPLKAALSGDAIEAPCEDTCPIHGPNRRRWFER
jgi:hypothetical protein